MSKSYHYQPAGELTISTTGNIIDLDLTGCGLVRMTNASLATIQGIKEGYEGQVVTFLSDGAGEVDFAHQNTSELTVARRLFNFVTSVATPLAAGVGRARYQYSQAKGGWCLITHEQGDYVSVAYNAGNFTGSGTIVWTVAAGDVTTLKYMLIGRSVIIHCTLDTTTVAGAGVSLKVTMPFTFAAQTQGEVEYLDNGTRGVGRLVSNSGASTFQANNSSVSNWAASTDNTAIEGGVLISIVS